MNIFFLIVILSSTYPVLEKSYAWENSYGIGYSYSTLSDDISGFPSINFTSQITIMESFGFGLSDFLFYRNETTNVVGNNLSFDILLKPYFGLSFYKNWFTKNYYWDYFLNSFALKFGGVIQYFRFDRNAINKTVTALGFKIGLSFNVLLDYNRYNDYFLKFDFIYNFMEDQKFFNRIYELDGLYISINFGFSLRFGKSLEWLFGENPNKPPVIKFYHD